MKIYVISDFNQVIFLLKIYTKIVNFPYFHSITQIQISFLAANSTQYSMLYRCQTKLRNIIIQNSEDIKSLEDHNAIHNLIYYFLLLRLAWDDSSDCVLNTGVPNR